MPPTRRMESPSGLLPHFRCKRQDRKAPVMLAKRATQGLFCWAPAAGPPFLNFRPGGLRTKTEFIGFPGRRTQTAPASGPHFLNFRPGGLRTKTEFIGFPGRRTQTAPASGPHFLNFRPGGLRTKTEFIGFAGRRTQTAPAAGPPFLNFRPGGLRTKTEFIGFAGTRARTGLPAGPALNERTGTRAAYPCVPGTGPCLTLLYLTTNLFPFVFSDADNTE